MPRVGTIWEFRELLYFLTLRDVKIRYKQTFFGVGWAILQPLLMMIVFSVFLGKLAGVPSDGVPYPLFALCGLIVWTLFAQSLNASSVSLVANSNLVSKIYFPRMLLPLASTVSFVVDLAVGLILLVALMVYYGVAPSRSILLAPLFIFLALIVSLAVGIWFSAVNARYRDVQYAIPFIVQLWLFSTPVAYPSSLVEGGWRIVLGLNPMTGVVEGFRWALLGTGDGLDASILISAAVAVIALFASMVYFRRVESTLADVI